MFGKRAMVFLSFLSIFISENRCGRRVVGGVGVVVVV